MKPKTNITLSDIVSMPKAALHTHIDGSIRPSTMLDLCRKQNKHPEYKNISDIIYDLCFQFDWDLPRCLSSFAKILDVLQDGDSLERVTYEHLEDLNADGVKYAELRFGPTLHGKLKPEEAVERVGNAIKRFESKYRSMQAYQKLSILRNNGIEEADKVADVAIKMHNKGHKIVAVDLAGNEYSHPPELFIDTYKKLRQKGIGLEAHAGEGPTTPIDYLGKEVDVKENIRDSVDLLKVNTLGHCYAMRNNKRLQRYVFSRGIKVVGCPTSSIHTKSISCFEDFPVEEFLESNNKYNEKPLFAIDADNYFLSRTTTSNEIFKLAVVHDLSMEQIKQLTLGSLECGFRKYIKPS